MELAAQQPVYADPAALEAAERALRKGPTIVELDAVRELQARLAEAAAGRSLLLQGGDCAETFDAPDVAALATLFHTLAEALPAPAVTVARIAGQFAKPRTIEGRVWRGEIVNSRADLEPDPQRMLRAYTHASATAARLPLGLYASHEALLLPYERGLLRTAADGTRWSGSGHLLWIGERTRDPDGAHVALAAGIANPVAVKLGEIGPDELRRLADRLDPLRTPGRLTLIVRMGPALAARLPALMRAMKQEGRAPLWVSDPLHGNTLRGGGRKVRLLPAILREIDDFVAVARAEGVHPGGLHLEMTPADVAEVTGGGEGAGWTTACDPRLNTRQALVAVQAFAAAWRQRDAA